MAKITTVIDIGSNSVRMAIFQKTSRFGFHTIYEMKSKVRISEKSYENNSYLQNEAMKRCLVALQEFKQVSQVYGSKKLICVATSALRDAPNKLEFLKMARTQCDINIKIIDGSKEAFFGAVACACLLHEKSGITVDIGGGSTEFSIINNGEVNELISINLGSIRLKELFFDRNKINDGIIYIKKHLNENLKILKKENMFLFGIGGSIRAFAKYVMQLNNYPLNSLHGYELEIQDSLSHINNIVFSNIEELKKMGIEKDRLDSIRPGLLILKVILEELNIKKLIISGVGIREGVFLNDMLRNHGNKFPIGFNSNLQSIQDRFLKMSTLQHKYYLNKASISFLSVKKYTCYIFSILKNKYNLKDSYLAHLKVASLLYNVGISINYYKSNKHASYISLNSLIFGYSHKDRVLISILLEYSGKKTPKMKDKKINDFVTLLPDINTITVLSFILSLSIALQFEKNVKIELVDNILIISKTLLSSSRIQDLKVPYGIDLMKVEELNNENRNN